MSQPQPLTRGAAITWTHYYPQSPPVERTGTVWARGPAVDGALIVVWVIPDQPLPADLYTAIAVGKATRRALPAHGAYFPPGRSPTVERGALYTSNYPGSPLGRLTINAHPARRPAHTAPRRAG
jgi:hypothetical protein